MPFLTSPLDNTALFYADYVPSPSSPSTPPDFTLLFLHGWPMSHEMYTHLLLPLSQTHNIRCIAPDRRGFGKSAWTGTRPLESGGVTYDTFAQDNIAVLRAADVKGQWGVVGASMGAGESLLLLEALKRHEEDGMRELGKRCVGLVWLGPSVPFPVKGKESPTAPGREVWEGIVQGLRADRVGFVRGALPGVFGVGEGCGLGLELAPTKLEFFEGIVRQADALAIERCVDIITGKNFTEELKRLDRNVLVLHGDSDQGMPASASAHRVKELVPDELCELKIYEKAAHGLYLTHAEEVMRDLLRFVVSVSIAEGSSA